MTKNLRVSLQFSLLALPLCAVLAPACGSGGNSGGGGAGNQFCNTHAAAFCARVYACTPAAMQDSTFHAFYGPSQSACTAAWAKTCTDAPPSGTTVDVNCSGGKHVNQAAETSCLNRLNSVSCDDFNSDGYTDDCSQVCGAGDSGTGGAQGGTGTGGRAGSGSGGFNGGGTGGVVGTGSGGAGGGSTPANPPAFCLALVSDLCPMIYQCTAVGDRDAIFVSIYGTTIAQCETLQGSGCSTAACPGGAYSPSAASTCLAEFASSTCDTYPQIPSAPSCQAACPQ